MYDFSWLTPAMLVVGALAGAAIVGTVWLVTLWLWPESAVPAKKEK